MITAILLAAAAASLPPDPRYCSLLGSTYEAAAYARDLGNPPQKALDFTQPYTQYGPSVAVQKVIINQVYFDTGFAYARGGALRLQMMDRCLHGAPQWTPLK